MSKQDLSGRTALVTGASSGLGLDFARELAARGADLVLVARREDRLRALAEDLRRDFGVQASVVSADLSDPATPAMLHQTIGGQQPIDILVNNAGLGVFGEELDIDWARSRELLQVDIVALSHLTKLFARDMRARGWGRILQVASIGAYQPAPSYAAYAAAKAYVLHFGEALNVELKGSGVSCTVVCPGVAATEFHAVAGQKRNLFIRMTIMPPARVAASGIRAMLRGRSSVVPGWMNRVLVFAVRFTPRWLQARASQLMMRN